MKPDTDIGKQLDDLLCVLSTLMEGLQKDGNKDRDVEKDRDIEWAALTRRVEHLGRDMRTLPPAQSQRFEARLMSVMEELVRIEAHLSRRRCQLKARIEEHNTGQSVAAAYGAPRIFR